MVCEDGSKFSGQPGLGGKYRNYYNSRKRSRLHCDEIDDLVRKTVKDYLGSHEKYQRRLKEGFSKLQELIPEITGLIQDFEKKLAEIAKDERKLLQTFNTSQLDDPTHADWLKNQIKQTSKE